MTIFDDSRAGWGAAANTNPRPVAASARLGISWHYDGGAALNLGGKPHANCLARVKADQTFHMSVRGWADIGYNLLICQHGRVIEGRGIDLQGAHSPGVNYEHYGVQFMVGGAEAPTDAAHARAVQLGHDLAAHSGKALRQWGHKDDPAASTDCPGPGIEAWVKLQGQALPPMASGGMSAPPPKPAPAPAAAPVVTYTNGRPNLLMANLKMGASNVDVEVYNDLLWKAQGAHYQQLNHDAWMAESSKTYGRMTEKVTGDTYRYLHSIDPMNWPPSPAYPCEPGPALLRRIGANPR